MKIRSWLVASLLIMGTTQAFANYQFRGENYTLSYSETDNEQMFASLNMTWLRPEEMIGSDIVTNYLP